jgi:hypothetical protein
MVKTGRQKRYLTKTINFGAVGEPARILIEEYVKIYGKTALSELIRRLVICHLSPKKEFDGWKIKALKEERKRLFEERKKLGDGLNSNADKLEKLGGNWKDFDNELYNKFYGN